MPALIFIIGFSGIIAQILFTRELLVQFHGNELVMGIILGNWVISEASGAIILGRYIDKVKSKREIFILLHILFALFLPVNLFFIRIAKNLLGISNQLGLGLEAIFIFSLSANFLVSFLHGALFSVSCCLLQNFDPEKKNIIAKVYFWEIVGTIMGGLFFTYLAISKLNSFQLSALLSFLHMAALILFFFKSLYRSVFFYMILFFSGVYLLLYANATRLHNLSLNLQWPNIKVEHYQNSPYGNLIVGTKDGQTTFYYNGLPIIVTPDPDLVFCEEFVKFSLLAHPHPKKVLLLGARAGGVINEMLKFPLEKIYYLELDPLLIMQLKRFSSPLINKELTSSQVEVINADGRHFLTNVQNKYDCIYIGLGAPSDLTQNRYFTLEFFELTQKRLNPEGILTIVLPGSFNYLSPELRDLNFTILNALKRVYPYIRIIPGDYNLILASSSIDLNKLNAEDFLKRLERMGIKSLIFNHVHLNYRLDPKLQEWFYLASQNHTQLVNQDLRPSAVFATLIFWNKQFSPFNAKLLSMFKANNAFSIFFVTVLIGVYLFFLIKKKASENLPTKTIIYSTIVFLNGFFAMLISLIILFLFQVRLGYLFYWLGLLLTGFMTGSAIGALCMQFVNKKNIDIKLLVVLELFMFVFVIFLFFLVQINFTNIGTYLFLSMLVGFLTGAQFILISQAFLREKKKVGEVAGILVFFDLAGGWLAGIFSGVILVPLLGVVASVFISICLKILLILLIIFGLSFKKNFTRSEILVKQLF